MSNCDFLFESFGESSLVSSERYTGGSGGILELQHVPLIIYSIQIS